MSSSGFVFLGNIFITHWWCGTKRVNLQSNCKSDLLSSCPSCHCAVFSIWTQAEIAIKNHKERSWSAILRRMLRHWDLSLTVHVQNSTSLSAGVRLQSSLRETSKSSKHSWHHFPRISWLFAISLQNSSLKKSGVTVKLFSFFLVEKIFPTVYSVHSLLLR